MAKNFNQILDECIDRINGGQSLEACLADYPEYREKLEPLLVAVLQTEAAYSFTPSAGAKQEARGRFNAALERLERGHQPKRPLFTRLIVRPRVWATAAAVLVVLMVGYFGLRPVLYPVGPLPSYS